MSVKEKNITKENNELPVISFDDNHPTTKSLIEEVLSGLNKKQKTIPPKFFYDSKGSKLFDQITQLPEYYPTRTEIGIIKTYRNEMAQCIGKSPVLIELGSGSSLKVQLLLEGLQPVIYIPIDISRDHLLESSRSLARYFPDISVHAVCDDYSSSLSLPDLPQGHPKVAFFPGSSIGNFEPEEALALLQRVADILGPGGGMLIGVDLQKDAKILNAAYNDDQNVTSEFNLNLLTRINSETEADFDITKFYHHAYYNEKMERIEMHLVSSEAQEVNVNGESFQFQAGESIHTENSCKYTLQSFRKMAALAGFETVKVWTDSKSYFSIHYIELPKV
ncbi:MAG: L-histidine N(alpha)-methyltransferase [Magnetococcales bacterium]|nr:L-histidine N(alpha)-methyltransferase [Magnetococcales bacterium]